MNNENESIEHKCELCPKVYSNRGSLLNHKRKYHKIEPKVQSRVENFENMDLNSTNEETIGNFKKIRWKINGIKDPLTVLTIYKNYVQKALSTNDGKKWTIGLKIRISREYPTIQRGKERHEEDVQ